MLRTYVKLELANTLTKHILLVIGQIQDVFNASRNKVSRLTVKAMQVCPRNKVKKYQILKLDSQYLSRFKMMFKPMLDSYSIDELSIKVYEKEIFNSDFHPIRGYMFGLSFLITLNIYKDYFKGHQRLRKCEAKFCLCKL